VTETGKWLDSAGSSMLAAVARAESDATGVKTFERYLWQAKQAVRLWLSCLTETDGPLYVLCERVEDVTLVYPSKVRFMQMKTRDRGSWSASVMCDKPIAALVRSYKSARAAGLHEVASFELWLEGPTSDASVTLSFVRAPVKAESALRKKILAHGLKKEWVDDFLARLAIYPDQPPRAYIDAEAVYELGSIWQSLPLTELQLVYERLLQTVTAAQAALPSPASVTAILAALRPHASGQSGLPDELNDLAVQSIASQILSREMLVALTPLAPGTSVSELLTHLSAGTAASLLELKMRSAGANVKTIQRTKEIRADMEVQRQTLLASRDTAGDQLEDLADRLLTVADATANRISLSAAVNPAAASRPAEAIALDLLSRPADLAQCDTGGLFNGDGRTIYGYLAHLSDECRFAWTAES
jgi:Cap4 dsDNA endonuclease